MPTISNQDETPPSQGDLLRVMFVTTELRMGGAERCLVNLATRLDSSRFLPTVVTLKYEPAQKTSELVERLRAADIDVQFLSMKSSFAVPFGIMKLRRIMKQFRPDLVQSFLFHGNTISSTAAKLAGVPVHVGGIRVAEPSKFRHRIERLMCRSTSNFVCVSKSVEDFVAKEVGLPADKLLTIPNGIDLEMIDRIEPHSLSEFGIKDNRRTMIFVGRLHEQKGLVPFFNQLPQLFLKHDDVDLLLVGDGPLRAELETIADNNSFSHRVHFAGWRADALSLIRASELLVLPSRWEGMPNVVMEAMALRKPVVAFDVHGVSELLGSNSVVQMCELQNYEKLGENLTRILTSSDKAMKFGEQNRQRIEEQFTLMKMIETYETLYKDLTTIPKSR